VKLLFYVMSYYLYTTRISRTIDSGTMLRQINNYVLTRTQHRVRFQRNTNIRSIACAQTHCPHILVRINLLYWKQSIAQGGEPCALTTVHCRRPSVQCSCAVECERAYQLGACGFSLACL